MPSHRGPFTLLRAIVLASAMFSCPSEALAQTPAPEALDEWQISRERSRITAADGVIRAEGGPRGWARTRRGVTDLILHLEFRVKTPEAAGAILLRAWTDRTNTFARTGYRVALRAGNTDKESLGQISGLSRQVQPTQSVVRVAPPALAEWQRLEVKCEGDAIEVRLNGQRVHAAIGAEPNAGQVGLEIEEGVLEVRNVSMTPIIPELPSGTIPLTDLPEHAVKPRLRREVRPRYTGDALSRRIEGKVELVGVITTAGRLDSVRVVRSLQPDLDAEAIAAVRQWRFDPASIDGTPVPVTATFIMSFAIHEGPR
jgi:TonB family protein